MDDHLKIFQNINQSVEQLLTNKHNSSEIKQSAISLNKSVQPCLEELKQSAARLKMLLQSSFDDLDHAEDVWYSKQKIAAIATDEIWKKLDNLRKNHFRIRFLGSQCKRQVIQKAQASWKEVLEHIERKWFRHTGEEQPKIIGKEHKNIFIQEIRTVVSYQSQDLMKIIKKSLNTMYQEITSLHLESILQYIIFLDNKSKNEARIKINLMLNEIEASFRSLIVHSSCKSRSLLEFEHPFRSACQYLLNHNCNDIDWNQFARFKKEVYTKIIEIVNTVMDDRVNFAIKSIGQTIVFYTDFLERQYRYQQETPQQREAEKAWIDQQRKQLKQVYSSIEAILDPTN